MKTLYLIRGLPGAGKTSLTESLDAIPIAADDYFYDENDHYNFDASLLGCAHTYCYVTTEQYLFQGLNTAVHNTFARDKDLKKYIELGEKYDYRVVVLTVENYHGGKSIHNVPEETMERMERSFHVKLR